MIDPDSDNLWYQANLDVFLNGFASKVAVVSSAKRTR